MFNFNTVLAIIIFVVIFGTVLFKSIRKNKDAEALKKRGNKVMATVDCVKVSITNHPRTAVIPGSKIHCIAVDSKTSQITEYETDYLNFQTNIPDINILEKPTLDVYVDPTNPQHYYIDITEVKIKNMYDPQFGNVFHGTGLWESHDGKNFVKIKEYDI